MDIKTLKKIANILNNNKISWGLGASSMLYFHGLVEKPRDIDLMVDEADAEQAVELLKPYTSKLYTDDGKGKYATRYFFEMEIDGQAVDVIGGYRILRGQWIYDFPVLSDLDLMKVEVEETKIPLTHIEDWYIAYLIMGDPKNRVPMIEKYVSNKNGFMKPERIEKAIRQIENKASFETDLLTALKKWV